MPPLGALLRKMSAICPVLPLSSTPIKTLTKSRRSSPFAACVLSVNRVKAMTALCRSSARLTYCSNKTNSACSSTSKSRCPVKLALSVQDLGKLQLEVASNAPLVLSIGAPVMSATAELRLIRMGSKAVFAKPSAMRFCTFEFKSST